MTTAHIQSTLETLSLSELERFGRASASRPDATFHALLASMTDDPRLVAAAMRGRRAALLEQAGDVTIRYRTSSTVSAAVRDDTEGVVDVTYSDGIWQCGCRAQLSCHHIAGVRQTLDEEVVA